MQRILADRPEVDLPRIVRLAWAYHGEANRLYQRQLDRLDTAGRDCSGPALEALAELAAMGPTARDRVLLVVRALSKHTPPRAVPLRLEQTVQVWLELAGDSSLTDLWNLMRGKTIDSRIDDQGKILRIPNH